MGRNGHGDGDGNVVDESSNHRVDKSSVQSKTPVKSDRAPSTTPVKSDLTIPSSTGAILLAGAMAGLAYTLCSHPLEMAAILMQSDVPRKRVIRTDTAMRTILEYKYNQGMLQCLKDVWHSGSSSLTLAQPLQPLSLAFQGRWVAVIFLLCCLQIYHIFFFIILLMR